MATQQPQANPLLNFSTMQKSGIARPPSPSYPAPKGPGYPSAPAGTDDPTKKNFNITNVGGATAGPGVSPISQNMNPGVVPPGVAFGPGASPISQNMNPTQGSGAQPGPGTSPIGPGMNPANPQNPSANWGNTGQDLYNQWKNSPAPQQFQPGSNPFQQGAFNYNNPMSGQLQSTISNQLSNPSAYTSDMALGTYNRLNQQMGQDYDYERQRLQEMMARRGFDASTLHGQRYSDLATEQGRAQSNLVQQLTTDAARQYSGDLSNAIGNAMGYGNMDYGQRLGQFNANLGGQNQYFNQGLNTFQANQGAQQQAYGQQQQNLANYLNFGQQDFNNQMSVANMNNQQQADMNAWLLQMMGVLG